MGEETAERTTWERCASLQVPPSSFCPSLLWQRYKVIECPVSGTTGEIYPTGTRWVGRLREAHTVFANPAHGPERRTSRDSDSPRPRLSPGRRTRRTSWDSPSWGRDIQRESAEAGVMAARGRSIPAEAGRWTTVTSFAPVAVARAVAP